MIAAKVRKLPLILLILLSSVLFPLSLPNEILHYGNAVLGFFSLAPLFAAAVLAPSYGFAAVLGMIFGCISTLLTSYWLSFFQGYSVWTMGSVALAYMGFNAMLFPYLRAFGRTRSGLRPILLAMAWTAYEYFKSIGFLAYPWGLSAYPVGGILPLIQIADVTGVYGVCFLLTFANALVAEWMLAAKGSAHVHPRILAGLALFWAILMAADLGYGAVRLATPIAPARSARFLLVQQNMDPWDPGGTGKVLRTNQDLTLQGLAQAEGPVDLAVWTESSMYSPYVVNGNEWFPPDNALVPYARKAGVHHLIGGVVVLNWEELLKSKRQEIGQEMNSAILMDPDGSVVDTYGKVHPVPFAEAVPFFDVPIVYRFFADVLDLRYMWTMGTRRTIFRLPLQGGGELSFAAPICFEDAFADLCRLFVADGADVLVNITNDSWSKQVSSEVQHFVAARWRAVENRRTLVRSANGGVSVVVDPWGKVRDMLPLFERTAKAVDVPIYRESGLTFYTRWGDWLPAAFLAVLFLALAAGLLPKRASGRGGAE
jgi:apolipoprotein N-acyltransferase